jgi:hypothetical protein
LRPFQGQGSAFVLALYEPPHFTFDRLVPWLHAHVDFADYRAPQ